MSRNVDRLIEMLKQAEWLKGSTMPDEDKVVVARDLLRMMPSTHTTQDAVGTLDVATRYIQGIAISPAPKPETVNAPKAAARATTTRKR
jgi:hypothetical protein